MLLRHKQGESGMSQTFIDHNPLITMNDEVVDITRSHLLRHRGINGCSQCTDLV